MKLTHTFFAFIALTILSANISDAQSFHTAVAKSPDAGSIFIYPERIPLKDGGFFNAERGLMFVPLNRSNADSDVISIELYRFGRSKKADPSTPPIFFLNGGPGFEGLEQSLARRGAFENRWRHFLDISDVVVVGQRGIGSSKPHTIIDQTLAPPSVEQSIDNEKAKRQFQEILAREKTAWEQLGIDLRGFTVLEAADDVNDIRKALGYKTITLWGGSFGSHWSMAIMRRHAEAVERAVLFGMEGPDHTYDHPGWLWNVFKRVAKEAEQADELKQLIPEGGLINAMSRLVKQAEEKPFTVPIRKGGEVVKVLMDGTMMKNLARGYSGRLQAWPADVITLHHGDFDQAAKRAAFRATSRNRRYGTASFWMLDCGSGITPERLAEYDADPAHDVIGSSYSFYVNASPVWKSDLGNEFRKNFETNIPTIIVHGTWDTSTPYENALELAPFFKNGKLVTVIRGSHGAIGEAFRADEEFKSAVMQFAESGEMSLLPDSIELPAAKWVVPKLKEK